MVKMVVKVDTLELTGDSAMDCGPSYLKTLRPFGRSSEDSDPWWGTEALSPGTTGYWTLEVEGT